MRNNLIGSWFCIIYKSSQMKTLVILRRMVKIPPRAAPCLHVFHLQKLSLKCFSKASYEPELSPSRT